MNLPISAVDLLPQKHPFQMIDTLLESNESCYKSILTVRAENVLVNDTLFTEGGMIENIAQTAAAGTGFYALSQGNAVPVGYIGAVKNIFINECPKVGDHINTTVIIKNNIGNASIAEGKIFLADRLLASCELTIFVNNN